MGWSALVTALDIAAPVRQPSCVSEKYVRGTQRRERAWRVFDRRYQPGNAFIDHLIFALRHEDFDLLILKRAFEAAPKSTIEDYVRSEPTGSMARRVWFFYEWLTDDALDVPDAPRLTAVPALDAKAYFTLRGRLSTRHRVRDNLLGSKDFCPILRRTEALEDFISLHLDEIAAETVGRTGAHLVARAASFLMLADSKASFEIEGERPPHNRLARWARAVLEAGKRPLNQTEIYRLHRILIGDDRFTRIGYRTDDVFLGERDHDQNPLPEFIGARPDDIFTLMTGLNICDNRLRGSKLDAVLQATVIAFGFVYIHPLADGNGRLHRCLIHHVLAERGFAPPGLIFPVSSVLQDRVDDYASMLRLQTGPLMDFIDWRPTRDRNVEVQNDTADLYRYLDVTKEAEFLYDCVRRTVQHDLPTEIDYLRRHDEAVNGIMEFIEMPDRMAQDLIMFVRQNDGVLPKRRLSGEFSKLTVDEVRELETIVRDAFRGFRDRKFEA